MVGRDGEKIGRLEEIYLDAESGQPEWAAVTTGFLGTKQSFVPLADFEPASIIEQVPALKHLLETRNRLRDLVSKVDRSAELDA